jgi:hypothetical protein
LGTATTRLRRERLDYDGFGAVPGWGEFAEAGYGGGDEFEGFVYFFLSGEAGEGEADARSGACGGEAHGGEDMGGFGCAGLTGGASANGEALEVEGDDQGFGFEVVEVDVAGVGDAGGACSVDAGVIDLGEDALFEAVAESGEVVGTIGLVEWGRSGRAFARCPHLRIQIWGTRFCGRSDCEPLLGEFGGFAEPYDAGYVFGAGAALSLVCAAVHHWGEADVLADEENADAFGRVDLVAGEGEKVDMLERALGGQVEWELGGGLDRVGVEECAGCVGDGG